MEPRRKNHSIRQRRLRQLRCIHRCRRRKRRRMEATDIQFRQRTPEAFTPDGKSVLFSAAIQDPTSSCQYPSGRLSEVYSVPLNGGAPVQFLATPAQRISWAADGRSMVYQDVKGFEDIWRKHHTSSVTRDIWRYTRPRPQDQNWSTPQAGPRPRSCRRYPLLPEQSALRRQASTYTWLLQAIRHRQWPSEISAAIRCVS